MLRAGITGGIGSGKSMICKIFELLGVPVFYADDVAKQLYDTNGELRSHIIKNFGSELYPNGLFDKSRMRQIVFNDNKKLQLLDSLVHPVVKLETEKWMRSQQAPYAIKEAALLIESKSYQQLDEIIFVECPIELRIKRVAQRDHLSKEQILGRIAAQMPDAEKKQFATQIIINDENHLIIPQVLSLHDYFIKKSGA